VTDPSRTPQPVSAAEPAPRPVETGAVAGAPPIDRSLPPDPAAYDSPRAVLARERGLSAPYIPGGRDPEPDAGLRQDRYYLRLLVVMVVVLVLAGFVLGIAGNLITASRGG